MRTPARCSICVTRNYASVPPRNTFRMVDAPLIKDKLNNIAQYREELSPFADEFSKEEILSDHYKYYTAERLFQLIVDEMLDINQLIIREGENYSADDFFSTFKMLGEIGALDTKFAERVAPMAGLRNRLVHHYEGIDRSDFIDALEKNFADIGEYERQVTEYVAR